MNTIPAPLKDGAFGHPKALCLPWLVPHLGSKGMRADHFLVHKVGRLSRAKAKHIIEKGDLRLDGQPLKASKILYGNEHLELWRLPPDDENALDKLHVGILYEDEHLLIINKPADLAMHPTARYLYHTLTHWLRLKDPHKPAHPCHRLDRETSGIVVCAKSLEAERALKIAFSQNLVHKTYLTVVQGEALLDTNLSWPLALQGERGLVHIKMVHDPQGLPSLTTVKTLQNLPHKKRSLIECKPHTGRQHQIRAHLALAGFPIVGDKLYAMGEEFFDAFTKGNADLSLLEHHRHALHAHRIQFELFKKRYDFSAQLPEDIQGLI